VEVSDLPLPSQQQAEPAFREFDRNWQEAVSAGDPKLMQVMMQPLLGKAVVQNNVGGPFARHVGLHPVAEVAFYNTFDRCCM
jgi:hypothetical protein